MQREAIIKDQTCGKGVERVLKKRQNMDVALLWSLKRFGILELRDSTWIPVAVSIPNLRKKNSNYQHIYPIQGCTFHTSTVQQENPEALTVPLDEPNTMRYVNTTKKKVRPVRRTKHDRVSQQCTREDKRWKMDG